MALRRKRTINPKYLSEDFESVFTEKKKTFLATDAGSENVVVVGDANLQVSEEPQASIQAKFLKALIYFCFLAGCFSVDERLEAAAGCRPLHPDDHRRRTAGARR